MAAYPFLFGAFAGRYSIIQRVVMSRHRPVLMIRGKRAVPGYRHRAMVS
jgi:hypothetical protein